MKQTSGPAKKPAEAVIKDIRRATRRQFSSEEKIRVVLEGLRGEDSIAELCRREGIAASMYYGWSKEFLEAGKKRLSGDTARAATTDEVRGACRKFGHKAWKGLCRPAFTLCSLGGAQSRPRVAGSAHGRSRRRQTQSPCGARAWPRSPGWSAAPC